MTMLQNIGTRLAARLKRLSALPPVRRLVRREDGGAAVEFALVAAPFLALLLAIMETALVFFAGQTLETAVADSSRLILTGQAQTQGFSQSKFQQAVCGKIYGLFNCSGVMVDVQTYSAFSNANTALPALTFDKNGNVTNPWSYQPGNPGDIVVVRVMYQWPVYMSLYGFSNDLANQTNGKRLLMATAAFQNEPYQ